MKTPAENTLEILNETIADFQAAETAPDYLEAENEAFDNLRTRLCPRMPDEDFIIPEKI